MMQLAALLNSNVKPLKLLALLRRSVNRLKTQRVVLPNVNAKSHSNVKPLKLLAPKLRSVMQTKLLPNGLRLSKHVRLNNNVKPLRLS